MESRAERVKQVLAAVLRQTMADASATHVNIAGTGADTELLRTMCTATLGPDCVRPDGLRVHPANKTTLLLSRAPSADILLLGDLYYSQVVELAGSASLPLEVMQLAHLCGDVHALDRALARFFDQRVEWRAAVADLPELAQELLQRMLEAARFQRARVGLVPKLGNRTLGIDLHV